MQVAMRVLSVTVTAVALTLIATVTSAYSDPLSKPSDAEARSHLLHGNRLYGIRSFKEAAAEYKAGALIEPAPVFDYNLGQCFRLLGRYEEATWHYERFLNRANPQGELLDAVTHFIAQMKAELDTKAMAQHPTEPTPLPASPAHGAPVSLASTSPVHVSPPILREAWYEDRWGWALSGAGIVGIAIGGGLLVNAASLGDEANMTTNQQERDRLRGKVHSRNIFGALTGAAGIGLLASGIVKFVIYPHERAQVASWNVGVTGNGMLAYWRF